MSTFAMLGLLCPFFFIGLVVLAIYAIIRLARNWRSSPAGAPGPPPLNVPTQLDQDGFWMLSCPADPGSIIYYHYWSGGARYSAQVPFKPDADGRQFVYTGRRPEQVSVTRIVEVDDDDPTASIIPPVISAGSVWEPPDIDISSAPTPPPTPPSFPSAY
jgi:hypothetical protein